MLFGSIKTKKKMKMKEEWKGEEEDAFKMGIKCFEAIKIFFGLYFDVLLMLCWC